MEIGLLQLKMFTGLLQNGFLWRLWTDLLQKTRKIYCMATECYGNRMKWDPATGVSIEAPHGLYSRAYWNIQLDWWWQLAQSCTAKSFAQTPCCLLFAKCSAAGFDACCSTTVFQLRRVPGPVNPIHVDIEDIECMRLHKEILHCSKSYMAEIQQRILYVSNMFT